MPPFAGYGADDEHQRGALHWDRDAMTVQVNRTEALDSSRAAVRERSVMLPRQSRLIEEFAQHLASDAKVLQEDEETGVKKFRYVKTGTNHFSLAFTYAWMAATERPRARFSTIPIGNRNETGEGPANPWVSPIGAVSIRGPVPGLADLRRIHEYRSPS